MRGKKTERLLISLLGVFLLLSIIPFTVYAAVPQTINYQGYLTDSGGNPVNGTVQMTFKIYNVASGGTALWTETQGSVAVSEGVYSVVLGSGTSINLAFDTQYYLGVQVEADLEMTPRQALTSVPYAMNANTAELAIDVDDDVVTTSKIAAGAVTSAKIATSAVGSAQISDGSVMSTDVGFNYAGSLAKGGAASDLDCAGCVSQSELDFTPGNDGDWTISGSNMYSAVSGNVGIGTGTTPPKGRLHIYAPNATKGLYLSGGWRDIAWPQTETLQIGSWDTGTLTYTERLLIRGTTGNVGIGTLPDSTLKLKVAGGTEIIGETTYGDALVVYGEIISFGMPGWTERGMGTFEGASIRLGGGLMAGTLSLSSTANQQMILLSGSDGRVKAKILELDGADIAETFDISDSETIKAGLVMSIDPEHPGQLKVADKAYDRTVAGIVSGAGGINAGMLMGQKGTIADGTTPVALTGRVYAWADASNGSIQPGDLLTTSDVAGHAMKVTDYSKAQGTIIGKAMTSLKEGKGLVLVLVTLQ